jgi:hypothetical protein
LRSVSGFLPFCPFDREGCFRWDLEDDRAVSGDSLLRGVVRSRGRRMQPARRTRDAGGLEKESPSWSAGVRRATAFATASRRTYRPLCSARRFLKTRPDIRAEDTRGFGRRKVVTWTPTRGFRRSARPRGLRFRPRARTAPLVSLSRSAEDRRHPARREKLWGKPPRTRGANHTRFRLIAPKFPASC